LWNLLEIISEKKLPPITQNPKQKFQRIENLNVSLNFLKEEKIALVNISAEDIEGGNTALALGLIWTIILRYP
jgi:hypothetical protein